MSNSKTIAFFGATGGCALAALSHTLEAGINARALVRTPQKLMDLLQRRGLNEELVKTKLVILQGNAKDGDAVQKTLVDDDGSVVDQIVFGVGGAPKMTINPLRPATLDDPVVCQTSMTAIVTSLRDLFSQPTHRGLARPFLTAVSTTGLSAQRDLPYAMIPLYRWAGAVMHDDKKVMEDMVVDAKAEGVVRDFVIVRASALTNGERLGLAKVRVGWETEKGGEGGPAIGYTISREDVGGFIFEEVIKEQTGKYAGKKVSVTY